MASSLGTAWIQIKPSMSGMTSAIRSGLSGVGEAQGASFGTKFINAFAAKTGAISGIVSTVFSKATNLVTSQISDAIERVDVLERFPRIMSLLGQDANASTDAVERLRDSVAALPISMSDAVSGAQRLTAVTGNVSKATDWIIAINDAMLSGTAPANRASEATEQFIQAISKGKFDLREWRDFTEVAAATADALAQSLGYASGVTEGDFYNALQKGEVSIEDMMNALISLDKNGSGAFPSLKTLAETSVGGIKTNITILQQSISNALAQIIQEIGTENILTIIDDIKNAIVGIVLTGKNVAAFVKDNWDWIQNVLKGLGASLIFIKTIQFGKGITEQVSKISKSFKSILGSKSAKSLSKNATSLTDGIGTGLMKGLDTIRNVLTSAAKAIVEPIKVLLKGVGEALSGFFTALADPAVLLGAAAFAAVAASIAAAIFLIGSAIGAVTPGIAAFMNDVILPLGAFLMETFLTVLDSITSAVIRLTNEAIIPLGTFLAGTFALVVETIANLVTGLTQNAFIPLINTLSGGLTNVLNAVANLLNGVISNALNGIKGIVEAVGESFYHMGEGIKRALEGVNAILSTFKDLITAIADAVVAVVALATRQSVVYGKGYARVTAAADGGLIWGPGTETSDSIPAMLSRGEYVIRASAARQIGYDRLDQMNERGEIVGSGGNNYFTINGYNKSPEELATIISRKIALQTQGVF